MAGFEWFADGPPPSAQGSPGKYAAMLAEIAETPGVWARILMSSAGGASTLASDIRRGKRAPGKWEAVSRKWDDGSIYTFVKYIGPE